MEMKMRLESLWLAVILMTFPALADPVVARGSFVVIKSRQKGLAQKDQCLLQGRVLFGGTQEVPRGSLMTGLYGNLSESGELIASDTESVSSRVQPKGEFRLEMERRLPIILSIHAPGFEPASIVLSTCEVSVDFILDRAANKP